MEIDAVIGANYGDEGKGLVTSFLCSMKQNPCVVLTNGGCQRGHTVQDEHTNRSHVFHHFSSGTFSGAMTYFPATYYMNPMQFVKELDELSVLGASKIKLARHPLCTMQLPSDILVNQSLEKYRGSCKHGSCGWGIFETFLRNKTASKLLVSDFSALSDSEKKDLIRSTYIKQLQDRLGAAGVPADKELLSIFMQDSFLQHFVDDFKLMEDSVEVKTLDNLAAERYNIIFENAQGLLLDASYVPQNEDGSLSVHTTPSSCGMNGVKLCIKESASSSFISNLDKVNACYVTRTYLTRHGAGPLENEDASVCFLDSTNVHNDWQGSIRFGKHNESSIKHMLDRIVLDSSKNKIGNATCSLGLAVTHVNEDSSAAAMICKIASSAPYCIDTVQSCSKASVLQSFSC